MPFSTHFSRAPIDRDRLLWRMAYETSARAEELLGQDVGDLDPRRREGL